MVFSSFLFLFYFLPFALLLYYAVPRRAQHLTLTLVSFVFYGWANPLFSFLLLFSTLVDYIAGLVIALGGPGSWSRPVQRLEPGGPRVRRQRAALITSICANLTLLAFFKYFNFGVDSFNDFVSWLGMPDAGLDVALRVALPLGISLYILQSLSYVIDVYRGDSTAMKSFNDFLCFEMMYPQLVAGPIIRYSEIEDQLRWRTSTTTKFARGIAFFSLGLAKKVLLANPCGKIADLAFEAGSLGPAEAWYGVTAYAFQIYFDFSGYSDMAIGLGLMLGFVFPKNFDSPVPLAVHHRILAPLAYFAFGVAARLPLRAAGWKPEGPRADLHQFVPRDADRGPVARRRVDLRDLGRAARRTARVRATSRKGGAVRQASRRPFVWAPPSRSCS